jgi:hypothetical protein
MEKPSDLKSEHPAFPNIKFMNCYLFFWAIFALLDPDYESGSGYGSRDPIESRFTTLKVSRYPRVSFN